jgi:hypothetical protein
MQTAMTGRRSHAKSTTIAAMIRNTIQISDTLATPLILSAMMTETGQGGQPDSVRGLAGLK